MRGTGRAVFAASLLLFVGTLNIFYGIGALGDAHVYVGETRLVHVARRQGLAHPRDAPR